MKRSAKPLSKTSSRGQSGQIVLEYVLLLVIGVSLAMFITATVASRNPESPGMIVQKWMQIITTIGADTADDLAPKQEGA